MMTIETLREVAPAAFATKPLNTVSERQYTFMPTHELIDKLAKMNWMIHSANQQKTKHEDRVNAVKHILHFRNPDFSFAKVGDTIPEILIVNSHDRTSSFRFYIGLFRLVCSNGLVVANGSLSEVQVPHIRTEYDFVKDQVIKITERVPSILNRIEDFKKVSLDEAAKIAIAERSLAARFPEYVMDNGQIDIPMIHEDVDIDAFLVPQRVEDADSSLWSTFNLVQEKIMKGGWVRETEKSRALQETRLAKGFKDVKAERRVRKITNIGKNIQVNQDLWEIADEYAKAY